MVVDQQQTAPVVGLLGQEGWSLSPQPDQGADSSGPPARETVSILGSSDGASLAVTGSVDDPDN